MAGASYELPFAGATVSDAATVAAARSRCPTLQGASLPLANQADLVGRRIVVRTRRL